MHCVVFPNEGVIWQRHTSGVSTQDPLAALRSRALVTGLISKSECQKHSGRAYRPTLMAESDDRELFAKPYWQKLKAQTVDRMY